jgi:hypothetical protein
MSMNSSAPTVKEGFIKLGGSLLGCAVLGPLLIGFFALSMWLLSLAGSEQATIEVAGTFDRPVRLDHLKSGPEHDPQNIDWKIARGETSPLKFKVGILFTSSFSSDFNHISKEVFRATLDMPPGLRAEPSAWDTREFNGPAETAFQAVQFTAEKDAKLGRPIVYLRVRRPGGTQAFERSLTIEIVDTQP